MASPEPSWRVKSRPCPFYQQGRCLFADSCNFLHVASATVASEALQSKGNASHSLAGPSTPHKTPQVIIDSPESIRSPPRSPRTTSLLLALRDIIGDADEEEQGSGVQRPSDDSPWAEGLKTLVNVEEGFGQYLAVEALSDDIDNNPYYQEDDDFEGNWTAISDYSDEEDGDLNTPYDQQDQAILDVGQLTVLGYNYEENTVQLSTAVTQSDRPLSSESIPNAAPIDRDRETPVDLTASGLLSPIELSTINLGNFFHVNHGSSSRGSNSFDSGYADHWKPPIPLQPSPPRSPSVNSTFDLLSSPFGARSSRILSHRLSAFINRSPISPARTVLSPTSLEEMENSDISLDSPSDYHSNQRDSGSVEEAVDSVSPNTEDENHLTDSALANQLNSLDGEDDDEDDDVGEESFGHTSIWDPEGGPTAVYMGNNSDPVVLEVNDAIKRLGDTPTHFLTSETRLEFRDHEVEGSSESSMSPPYSRRNSTAQSPSEFGQTEGGSEEDTAFLAYLNSPVAQANENDTLGSFYDIYSGIAPEADTNNHPMAPAGQDLQENLSRSNSSTPASSLRERVFTPPPPTRQRSGTITADSPNSLSSPITSLDSMSGGRASPLSMSDTKSPMRRTGSQSPYGQEIEVSRKIPFGFKNSFPLGRSSRSSLMASRSGRRSVPSSPLQIQTNMPGPSSRYSSTNHSPTSPTSGLKPLRLSTVLDTDVSRSLFQSCMPSSAQASTSNFNQSGNSHRTSSASSSVSSNNSFSDNRLLSSARSSLQPLNIRNSIISPESQTSSPSSPQTFKKFLDHNEPRSAPATSWRQSINYSRPSSRLSQQFQEDGEEDDTTRYSRHDPYGETIRRPIPMAPYTAPPSYLPTYAIKTPKPTLMFAIASDNIDEVKQVLNSGEADPNESFGPQSALLFALTNDKLANRLDIVKTLLAYGADPAIARKMVIPKFSSIQEQGESQSLEHGEPSRTLMDEMDPATRYYLERADAIHTRRMSVLIQRSFFKSLTRVRYELVGQDRALEQLFRVLSMHSKEYAITPMVVMLCGPSGHGKSLLARKFGSLLDVPTHTVNMTTLRSTHDLWQSYSMSPYEDPTSCTLAEFLINNEGKRCVVVLDEIEKTADQNTLWSLLMPWELGRCSFEAGSRHVDVKNVIWLGTSNIGHDLVFSHHGSRKNLEEPMSRQEYVELMALLRPQVSERLGASVLSRITTVLPFVPFSMEEKRAICSEALYTLGGEFARSLPQERVDGVIASAVESFISAEGARSLSRAISNQLLDII